MSSTALVVAPGAELAEHADVASLVQEWTAYERAEGNSENTTRTYRRAFQKWIAWLEHTASGAVTPAMVRAFKAHLAESYSAQTVNLCLTAVRAFYRFMLATGRTAYNPAEAVRGVKRPKSRTHKRDALSRAEVRAVLGTCDPGTLAGVRDCAILVLMAYCGLRTVEVHRADIGDLRTEADRLTLRITGKGHTEADDRAIIPRHQEAVIRAWLAHRRTFKEHGQGDPLFVALGNRTRGGRLGLRSIRHMVKERFYAAGVTGNKSTHSLRHSAITAAVRAAKRDGRSAMDVQAFARHQSFDTTMGYVHETGRLDNPIEDAITYGDPGQ